MRSATPTVLPTAVSVTEVPQPLQYSLQPSCILQTYVFTKLTNEDKWRHLNIKSLKIKYMPIIQGNRGIINYRRSMENTWLMGRSENCCVIRMGGVRYSWFWPYNPVRWSQTGMIISLPALFIIAFKLFNIISNVKDTKTDR